LTLALPARAKLNLDLEVVGRHDDGYHELRTTFQAIELHDLLLLEPASETQLTVSGFSVRENDNSVLAAHRAAERAAGRSLPTKIHLHKRIPPGSGMGGASSDAATTLKGLKTMYSLEIDLAPLARELGSDVPFFLAGGRARAEGRGERLTPLTPEPAWFAIAWPGIELATADVYRAWDEVKGEGPNHLRRAAEHVEPRLKEFAKRLGPGWQMTGSGSAFFKQTNTEDEGRNAIASLDSWSAVTHAV
jgi:4-diphosphocytidyl-2-C-methyl-D-erythritol kinase